MKPSRDERQDQNELAKSNHCVVTTPRRVSTSCVRIQRLREEGGGRTRVSSSSETVYPGVMKLTVLKLTVLKLTVLKLTVLKLTVQPGVPRPLGKVRQV